MRLSCSSSTSCCVSMLRHPCSSEITFGTVHPKITVALMNAIILLVYVRHIRSCWRVAGFVSRSWFMKMKEIAVQWYTEITFGRGRWDETLEGRTWLFLLTIRWSDRAWCTGVSDRCPSTVQPASRYLTPARRLPGNQPTVLSALARSFQLTQC